MDKIAVIIPCYNEGITIGKVIRDFKHELPEATIYVYDNNSKDNTIDEAQKAGAIVREEQRQGKGNVIRSMLNEIDADIYVMVDGDSTYPAEKVHQLIAPVAEGSSDMSMGSRLHSTSTSSFKMPNLLGNKLYVFLINIIFGVKLTDLLTGYRAFNKRVANLPILSKGFEIETELTLKTVAHNHRIAEVPVSLVPRPEGSESKIRIFRDGFLILNTIFSIVRDYKPLTGFGLIGLLIMILGLLPGSVVIWEFQTTGYVSRLPFAVLSVGIVLSGMLFMFAGLVLHAIARRFQELDYQVHRLLQRLDTKQKD